MVAHYSTLICLPIDLICADMDEPLDLVPSDLAGLKENMGPIYIVLGELKAVAKGVVNMRLGSKVHNCVNGLCGKDKVDKISTGDIALDELEVGGGVRGEKVVQARAVV